MKNTDKMKNIITFLLVFFTATTVWAEKVIVSGTVVDSNKEPLIGVNVTVKDAPGLGTITDIDGRYRIEIDAYSTLLFSYIGFDTYKVLIKENMKVVNVQMKESSNNVIDEVVITGTGAQKKISVTGAITTVGVKELQTAPGGNLSNAWQVMFLVLWLCRLLVSRDKILLSSGYVVSLHLVQIRLLWYWLMDLSVI